MTTAENQKFNMSAAEIEEGCLEKRYIERSGEELNERDLENIGLVRTLLKTGMGEREVRRYLELLKLSGTENERIFLLRMHRAELLEEIHKLQQSLDHIDLIIFEINRQNKK